MTSDQDTPADRYYIGGAGLPVSGTEYPFAFERARRFQRVALDWMYDSDGSPPVSAVAAPTGSGKTAIIAALAAQSETGIVCTYPTNALIHAQAETLRELEAYDLTVKRVTSATLENTGEARANEVLDIADQPNDVVVTNPDILQAIIQSAYFSPGNRVFQFFSRFDAAVFDEFHYYDPLAASGLLMQIRILANEGRYRDREGDLNLPRVLLTSATPDEQFVESVTDDFGIDAQIIRSRLISLDLSDPAPQRLDPPDVGLVYDPAGTPPNLPSRRGDLPAHDTDPTAFVMEDDEWPGVSRFRYPMVVNRWPSHIGDAFDTVAKMLDTARAEWDGGEPVAAVVFNSAARSNAFQEHIRRTDTWTDLADVTRKDNGYDTGAEYEDRDNHNECAVLNTTSKGEVGLNFDIRRLVVAMPWTVTSFIQRVGRAARQSPATVDVFGLGDPAWPPVQSYAGFLARIQTLDELRDPTTSRQRLRALAGLRAARATQSQYQASSYDPDIEVRFDGIPGRDRWNGALRALNDAQDAIESGFGEPTVDRSGRRAIRGADAAIEGLDALRGRSVQVNLMYPIGDGTQQTEYDLIRALRHYPIEHVDPDNTLRLGRGTPDGQLTATYPERPFGGLDMRQSDRTIESKLTDGYQTAAQAADLRSVDIDAETLQSIFGLLPLRRALLPTSVDASWYRFTIDQEFGEVEIIDERRPD